MIALRCDKCKTQEVRSRISGGMNLVTLIPFSVFPDKKEKQYHICDDCVEQFERWLNENNASNKGQEAKADQEKAKKEATTSNNADR